MKRSVTREQSIFDTIVTIRKTNSKLFMCTISNSQKAASQNIYNEPKWYFPLKPWKLVLLDMQIFLFVNTILLYSILWFVRDSSIAMISVIFVSIIAYKHGVIPALLASFLFMLSDYVALSIPPHNALPLRYLFNNKVPGYAFGLAQSFITGLVIGYISSLVHRLQQEVSFRKQIQNELEQKIAELDAFGHTVAHDLRNPLMIINMSSQALIKDFENITDNSIHRKLRFIYDSTEHMVNIIESILLLAGLKKISPQQFSIFFISQCVEDALNRLKYNIESSNATIIQPQQWPNVFGYPRWITEVWVNYVNNALKYGMKTDQDDTTLRIELGFQTLPSSNGLDNESIKFWVKDFGDGIPDEKKPFLFQEFSRLQTSQKRGYGLGLSIVKSIITRSGGSVGVESQPGQGSCFYFTLPTKPFL